MKEHVKICPRCKHLNSDDELTCQKCTLFIMDVTSVPKESIVALEPEKEYNNNHKINERYINKHQNIQRSSIVANVGVTTRVEEQLSFYLEEPGTGKLHEIQSGYIIGQAHETSVAQVRLSGLHGVNFIHRCHCRITCHNGQWSVQAIDQREFGRDYTNPTLVNDKKLSPGSTSIIRNGDRLVLSKTTFIVRMITS